MKIVVTGASGGLGSQFIETVSAGFPAWDAIPFTREIADITNVSKVVETISAIKPEVILHACAMTSVDQCESDKELAWAVNVEGTLAVAKAAGKTGARIIFISTDYVFDGKKSEPYIETDSPNPLNVYGKTKLEGERAVSKLERSLIVRTSWLYGSVKGNFPKTMLGLAERGAPIRVVDDQIGAPTSHADLARAIAKVIDKGTEGILSITNSGSCSWYGFAKAIFDTRGLDVKVHPVKSHEYARPAARPANSRLDCSRYTEITGEPMRDWRDALKEFLIGLE